MCLRYVPVRYNFPEQTFRFIIIINYAEIIGNYFSSDGFVGLPD